MVTPRKKVTDATKAKLPLPKGHPQRKSGKRKRCPSCEKMVLPADIHTCYDAKALREAKPWKGVEGMREVTRESIAIGLNADRHLNPEPSPIAGQPLPEGLVSAPAPTFQAFAMPGCETWLPIGPQNGDQVQDQNGDTQVYLDGKWHNAGKATISATGYREPLYDTRPIPWSWETLSTRRWLSNKLTALAKWVAP